MKTKQWEYKIEEDIGLSKIEKLGQKGWELCAIINHISFTELFFKRPKYDK